ncbi:hypothetical protein PVAP13_4NG219000 [Panicum virgatum]|uniref:Glycine-rich protein n=1 Tax=Panicum virgatum TaxID=38727 RepID=A0A8T0T951_PANVG|nr:hypothetical protein PVAP13_4NG219000 [Panicum virgatum]
MANKFVVLLGVVLAFLLVCQDLACARGLTETNESEGKDVKPAGGVPGLKDEKWGGGYNGGYGNGGSYGGGYGGGYGPRYGGGYHHGHGGGGHHGGWN